MEKELRFMPIEIRSDGEDEDKKAVGLGIIYDEWTEIYPGFKERILRGAVNNDKTVKSFFNHDPSKVLSTTRSKPALELNDTEKGLEYVSPIPPTSYGKDLVVNLERGNVKGSSFAFSVPKEGHKSWEEDGVYFREIKKLILYEIGPVVDPAYVQTTAQLRTAEDVYNEVKAEITEAGEAEQRAEDEKRQRELIIEADQRELVLIEKQLL